MAGKEFSYDYQNDIRDVSTVFQQIVLKIPTLAAMLGAPLMGLDGAPLMAKNKKHEWMEDVMAPKAWVVNATRNTSGASLTLVSTAGIKVGMVLGFESALGNSKSVQLVVTAVTNGTTLAVSVYGGTTDVQLVATNKVFLIALPKNESTLADPDAGYEPTMAFNYTQIFDRTAKISKTSEAVAMYGIASALDYQVQNQLRELAYDMGNTIIHGRRVARDVSNPGSMGGIMYFMQNGTNNVIDAANAAISPTIMNNGYQQGLENGADNMVVAVCAPGQARRVSAFNTSGANPIITRDEKTTGSYVMNFVSDLPVGKNGMISKIIVDQSFPKDKILLLDPTKVGIVPLRKFQDEDATPNGADFFSRRILGEYTMEFKNASQSHMLFEGLLP